LICTSGCIGSEIPFHIKTGNEDQARHLMGWYQDVFGKENFFLELQNHEQVEELPAVNQWLYENQGYVNAPLLATNDTHYIYEEDADAHDTLLCIQTATKKADAKRMRMSDNSYFLRSPQEMFDLFKEVPESLSNTVLVAEMCDLSLDSKGYHLPLFPVPEGYMPDSFLRHLAESGLRWRFNEITESLQTRLDYELRVIHTMGFDTYFLIVWDLCQFARFADIWWNVRGSAAGSLIAYCLGITNIDPIQNGLIFERFLNPGRLSMPDIDMDFPDDRRMEMIEYAMNKYGAEKVAAIITFGTMKARAAIKDVARTLDIEPSLVNPVTALVPQIPSRPVTLSECLFSEDKEKAVPALREIYENDKRMRPVFDTAITVEGVARNAGTHAAGVIISDKSLTEYLPLYRPIGDTKLSQVTQFPMETCESIGLLKVDFLGLSTLTIMRKACELIERYHGIQYTMDNIPYRPVPGDPLETKRVEALFDLIGRGDTTGVFQLEGGGMKRTVMSMKPRTFEHVVAAIALFRPGPMQFIDSYVKRMHGEEQFEYLHPKLEPILSETYAICVYQEQIQQIAADLFGYTLGDADLMRRAVSKKKPKDLQEHKAIFMEKGPENGVSVEVSKKIFEMIEYFAAYGFNKSHSADYAVLTCQTAYLKAHYPEEYYTALLSVQRDNIADVAVFTNDCRKKGIPVLPPDINSSDLDFTIVETNDPLYGKKRGIRYALSAIKNAGERAIEILLEGRGDQPFRDIGDFCRRVDLRHVGRKTLEVLIKVGAMDSFGDRDALLAVIERLMKYSLDYHEARAAGQLGMFGDEETETFELPKLKDNDRSDSRQRLKWEKELLGLPISSHPLTAVIEKVRDLANYSEIGALRRDEDTDSNDPSLSPHSEINTENVTLVGLVSGLNVRLTRSDDNMGIFTLEDLTGAISCVAFPKKWRQIEGLTKKLVQDEGLAVVRGKYDLSRGDPQIIVESISDQFETVRPAGDDPYTAPTNPSRKRHEAPTNHDLDEPQHATPVPRFVDDSDLGEDGLPNELFNRAATPTPSPRPSTPVHGRVETAPPSFPVLDIAELLGSSAPVPKNPPVLITLTIRRTENPERDQRKITRLRMKLDEYPGRDRYRFRMIMPDGRIVWVEYPDASTHYSREMENFLTEERTKQEITDLDVATLPPND